MFANLEPRQFIPASKGKVSLTIQNLDAAETIYLHKDYEKPLGGWKVPFGITVPNFDWVGGLLWISASANHDEYQMLEVEPERGRRQEWEEKKGGAGSGGGGGGDGVPPPAGPTPPAPRNGGPTHGPREGL